LFSSLSTAPARSIKDGSDTAIVSGVFSVVAVQAGLIVCLAGGLLAVSPEMGEAALSGGLSIVVPNAWFAWASTRRKPGEWLLMQGVVKFVLAVVLMGAALKSLAPDPLGFFSGVFVALVAHIAASARWQTTG
jgi:F0F1-type ATP synthase assembly protein I